MASVRRSRRVSHRWCRCCWWSYQRVVIVELFERETSRLEIVVAFDAQLFVAIVEVLRELVGDLLLPRGRQPEGCQSWTQVIRPSGAQP